MCVGKQARQQSSLVTTGAKYRFISFAQKASRHNYFKEFYGNIFAK